VLKRFLNVVVFIATITLIGNLLFSNSVSKNDAIWICSFIYIVVLVLNYTIYAQISIWHGDKIIVSQINKVVLVLIVFAVAQSSYGSYKERKQAEVDEISYAECLKKNEFEEETKKDIDNKEDDFIAFLHNAEKYSDCITTKK
jgi:hypothetical protein